MKDNKLNAPEEENIDFLHKILKGSVGLIPFGPVVAELFEIAIGPSISKRRTLWMKEVTKAIEEIKKKDNIFEIEKLRNNEEFITSFIYLSQIALKSHQNEKYTLLKNVLKNSYLNNSLDFDFKLVLMKIVEETTLSQVILLRFYKEHEEELKAVADLQKFHEAFKRYNNSDLLYKEFVLFSRDLEKNDLLVISNDVTGGETVRTLNSSWITVNEKNQDLPFIKISELGSAFLSYLS